MLSKLQYPVYTLAAEYESCVAMLNTEARPNLYKIIKKAFEKEGWVDRTYKSTLQKCSGFSTQTIIFQYERKDSARGG